jgi:hypothetical protein
LIFTLGGVSQKPNFHTRRKLHKKIERPHKEVGEPHKEVGKPHKVVGIAPMARAREREEKSFVFPNPMLTIMTIDMT